MRRLWMIAVALLLTAGAWAEQGVVTAVSAGTITINRGSEEGVRKGSTWTVVRDGQTVGQAVVDSLDEYSATAVVSQGSGIRIGDLVTSGGAPAASGNSEVEVVNASLNSRESLEQAEGAYRGLLDRRTEDRGFETRLGGSSVDGWQALNTGYQIASWVQLFNANSSIGLSNNVYTPYVVQSAANAGMSHYWHHQMRQNMKMKVHMEATYWDQKLCDAYAGYLAARENLDIRGAAIKKMEVARQKGADRYAVFEVTFENTGRRPTTLSPIDHHVLLVNADGRYISPSKIDQSLNVELRPGEKVHGYLYYPKISAMGVKELKLRVQGLLGDEGDLSFSL